MRIINIFFLLINFICFGQDIRVTVDRTHLDTLDNKNILLAIQCKVEGLNFNNDQRIRLIQAEGKDINNVHLNVDEFDYFGYDDMVIKNTFLINFESKNKITEIKEINGVLRHFNPTIENHGKRTIQNPLTNNSTNIFLDQEDIRGCILNIESLRILKKNSKKQFKARIKQIALDNNFDAIIFDSSLKWFLKEYKNYRKHFKQTFAFYIEDPKDKFVEIKTYDAETRMDKMIGSTYKSQSKLIMINYHQQATANWKMDFEIETETSIKDYNFNLRDVVVSQKNYID